MILKPQGLGFFVFGHRSWRVSGQKCTADHSRKRLKVRKMHRENHLLDRDGCQDTVVGAGYVMANLRFARGLPVYSYACFG